MPERKVASAPKSRREILREMFVLGANHVGECATLAVRAGYGTEEIAEAMRAVEPGKIEVVPEETEQPWLQEG